jgi:hypothetical protein
MKNATCSGCDWSKLLRQPGNRDKNKQIKVFNADQVNEGWTAGVLGKYTRELARLQAYCEGQEVYTVQGIANVIKVKMMANSMDIGRPVPVSVLGVAD